MISVIILRDDLLDGKYAQDFLMHFLIFFCLFWPYQFNSYEHNISSRVNILCQIKMRTMYKRTYNMHYYPVVFYR